MKSVSSFLSPVAGNARRPFRTARGFNLLLTSYSLLLTSTLYAQTDIPIGTWRMHLSYNTITSVALSTNKVYGAAESGILIFDRIDNSLSSYNRLNGLTGTGISCIAYDANRDQLLIAYNNGDLDILKNNVVTNFNRLKNSSSITGSKKINHIAVQQDFAYLATDYGVVVFDLQQLELKETWRDLGPAGETLKILESTFFNDSIFLATEKGVLAGDTGDNLLDFNSWKRNSTGDFANPVISIAAFNNKVYATISGAGVYRYDNGQWTKESFLQNETFNFLTSTADFLLIGTGSALWKLNASGLQQQVVAENIVEPQAAAADAQQKLWIGDRWNGLLSDFTGSFISYIPNGPTTTQTHRLKFLNQVMYALPGGYTLSGLPLENQGDLNFFENGSWAVTAKSLNDLTDIEAFSGNTFLSSFGDGIERTESSGSITLFDQTNSSLENVSAPDKSVFISAIESSANGLWVANYAANQPIHLFDGVSWQPYTFGFPQASYPLDIITDFENNLWMRIDPERGGGLLVFNKEDNTTLFRSETTGNGALPNRLVHAFALDRDGLIWVGTLEGVAYFFSADDDAIKPIFDNRFLLRDEKITALAVDDGNRKWIGTENGVWLFSPSGEELIHNFTEENSPLLSNKINDIEINPANGEVFFSTDKGIVSYRADATGTSPSSAVKIFPNPVTSDFTGMVGISGLPTDAFVKITDVSGKLIWQTQANGSTAAWNVRDYNGRRAATGIYLVFAATLDGTDSVVGKIAVIE